MTRRSPKTYDLYRTDLERHLFAPEPRNRRQPRPTTGPAGWLRVAAAIVAWALSSAR